EKAGPAHQLQKFLDEIIGEGIDALGLVLEAERAEVSHRLTQALRVTRLDGLGHLRQEIFLCLCHGVTAFSETLTASPSPRRSTRRRCPSAWPGSSCAHSGALRGLFW